MKMDFFTKFSCAFICLGLLALLGGCSTQPRLVLSKTSYENLPAWKRDNHNQSLAAFQRSCREIQKRNPKANFSKLPYSGKVQYWQEACYAASQIAPDNKVASREFFEHWFQPYQVRNNANTQGLFTGYYLPLLHGSLTASRRFSIPIYGVPRRLSYRPDRAAINNGAIHRYAPVLVWTDNWLDVFFAQIQGSALVELPNRERFIISYAGNNGHRYTAIGKVLRDEYGLPKETISMQTIRQWLEQHPEQMHTVLNRNASYVYFRILKDNDPHGAERIPLTPERSLAVDTRFIPLGVPLWLNTTSPTLKQLMIAQDTGGAIKGVVRGDVYWGTGEKAKHVAGYMQSRGQYWILLPKRDLS